MFMYIFQYSINTLPNQRSHICHPSFIFRSYIARHWWLKPIILATREAEFRRIVVGSQSQQMVCEILLKTPNTHTHTRAHTGARTHTHRASGVAQMVEHSPLSGSPEFKHQYAPLPKKEAI
jgi:hypothetical protein